MNLYTVSSSSTSVELSGAFGIEPCHVTVNHIDFWAITSTQTLSWSFQWLWSIHNLSCCPQLALRSLTFAPIGWKSLASTWLPAWFWYSLSTTLPQIYVEVNNTAPKLSDYCNLSTEIMLIVPAERDNKNRAVSILSIPILTVIIRVLLRESQVQAQSGQD